nr:hypothetical protein [Tanacetum cinerariifolium]
MTQGTGVLPCNGDATMHSLLHLTSETGVLWLLELGKRDFSVNEYLDHLGFFGAYFFGNEVPSLYCLGFTTRHNRGAFSWYYCRLRVIPRTMIIGKDCTFVGLSFDTVVLERLMTPDLTCPSTYQLLQNSPGCFRPNMSFDMLASPEYLSSLARASLAENPPYELGWKEKAVFDSEGNPTTSTERVRETYKTVTQEIRDQLNAEAEAVQIILIGIDNDIY